MSDDDHMNQPQSEGRPPEMVTLAEIARRVGLSKQRVQQLSNTPEWPVPKEQWQRVGRYYFLPWEPVKAWFDDREPVRGVHLHRDRPKEDDSG